MSFDMRLASQAETASLGKAIGRTARGGDVVALIGDLGAGKTTLVKGIAAGTGADPASVCSPTFVLVHRYPGRIPLIHADLYRMRSEAEAEGAGLHELFDDRSLIAVEWADRIPGLLPVDRLELRLAHENAAARAARLQATGARSLAWLMRVRRRLSIPRRRKAVRR